MTQIRNYAIERLASTIYDDDLLDVQIMEAGADQYEEARMKVSELRKLMNDGSTPLRYKALLSQNAPVATTQTPSIIAGQIWEDTIGTADAGDLVILGGYELISGTLGDVNAKYRSAANNVPIFITASLEYDGSPYVVSTDANGDFNPFVNTLGGDIVFSYDSVGSYIGTLSGAFPLAKTDYKTIGQRDFTHLTCMYGINSNSFYIDQALTSDGTPIDTLLYQSIEIEVYP
jgi:hypothetical protein